RAGPLRHRSDAFNTKALEHANGKLPEGWRILGVPPNTTVITCGPAAGQCPGVNSPQVTRTYYYLFTFTPNANPPVPQLTGKDLKLGGTQQDFDPQTGKPEVLMQFTGHGANEFQRVTRDEYTRGRLENAPQHFAIVLDGDIKSWPQIDFTDS